MDEKVKLTCHKCQVDLVELEATFRYLNRSFQHKVHRCPRCGQVYIPEELAKGKMRQVEEALEEK